ncbi:IS3 family transposase [Streptomyces sp. NPDC002787]
MPRRSTVPGRGRASDRPPAREGPWGRSGLPGAGVVAVHLLRPKKRPKSARRLRDEQLMPLIEEIHAESGATYGARRITRALRRRGVDVARCTVERLIRELGVEGVIRGERRRTTVPSRRRPARRTSSTATSRPPDRTSSGWRT